MLVSLCRWYARSSEGVNTVDVDRHHSYPGMQPLKIDDHGSTWGCVCRSMNDGLRVMIQPPRCRCALAPGIRCFILIIPSLIGINL